MCGHKGIFGVESFAIIRSQLPLIFDLISSLLMPCFCLSVGHNVQCMLLILHNQQPTHLLKRFHRHD